MAAMIFMRPPQRGHCRTKIRREMSKAKVSVSCESRKP
jgi:hypothetical protein